MLAVLLYILVLLAVGLRFPKRLRNLESYFLASRNLGAVGIALSLSASWIGAASLLVSTDEAYREGLSAFWIIGVPAVATLVLFIPLAKSIRALSGSTLSDLMEARYGKSARTVTTILIIWYMVVLAASQMVAAGVFLGTFLGTPYVVSLGVVTVTVVLYSGAGGFLSVVKTHGLQTILLVAGLVGLLATLGRNTSWAAFMSLSSDPGRIGFLDFFANAERNLLIAASFILAWTISPIAWQRIQASRGVREARLGLGVAALILGVVYTAIVSAGMLFLTVFPQMHPSHPLIPEFLVSQARGFIGALLFLAVLAAIFSTLDAALNAGAFSLSRDILRLRRDPERGGGSLRVGRASTLVLGVAAFLIATRFEDILKTLGLASKIMAEGLFIPGLAAVFLRKKAPPAGLLSLFCGGGFALLCFLEETGILSIGLPLWPRSLPWGVSAGATGFVLGAAIQKLGTKRLG